MILITSYFDDPLRKKEFDFCLKQNIKNKYIKKILLFHESGELPVKEGGKLEVIESYRPTFKDHFDLIEEGEDNIISNTDIFFGESVIMAERCRANDAFCITRHEYNINTGAVKPFKSKPMWSQDVWIMRRKPKQLDKYQEVIAKNLETDRWETIPFYMGVAGCDNHVAWWLNRDFVISNPYEDIKCFHAHLNPARDYKMKYRITGRTNTVFGNLRNVPPKRL